MSSRKTDVLVVGAGNAALCAALSAQEKGAQVLVIEAAPFEERAGNTAFTAGAMRVVYNGVEDIEKLIPDLTDEEKAITDFGTYTEGQFFDHLGQVTQYRCDPDLTELLVTRSQDTLLWMREQGVRFLPMYGRTAFKVDGRFKFWGGITIEVSGGGPGLVEFLMAAIERAGIEVLYDTPAVSLIRDDGPIRGVMARHKDTELEIQAKAVVLACGGFEANAEWRSRYLGPGWDLAKVRGSRFNTGGGIKMALEAGASPRGNWSGCHAVGWDRNAPEFGDLAVGDQFQKHSYQFGIIVNARGERFVDEGADFRTLTYAKYGRAVLEQPQQFAWQVFDAKMLSMLRDEYRIRQITKVRADTLEDLVKRMEDVDPEGFLKTVSEFNAAVMTEVPFDPNVKDGRGTRGLALPKSNWANLIDEPPFEAYEITCGITFTFGGLRITNNAEVLDNTYQVISGLYAAGEMVGGIFYFNYPGGTGLTSGAVFGRIAGTHAGSAAAGSAAAKR